MNKLTIEIESFGGSDEILQPLHVVALRKFFNIISDKSNKLLPVGKFTTDYENVRFSWKVERGLSVDD